jgi:hypothetical protein
VIAGDIRQGPFAYEIADVGEEEWTFRYDPAAGSFTTLDVRASRPTDAEVAEAHRVLSTPPDGWFTRVLVVQRRDDTRQPVHLIRGAAIEARTPSSWRSSGRRARTRP